jgi:hypothetical protein
MVVDASMAVAVGKVAVGKAAMGKVAMGGADSAGGSGEAARGSAEGGGGGGGGGGVDGGEGRRGEGREAVEEAYQDDPEANWQTLVALEVAESSAAEAVLRQDQALASSHPTTLHAATTPLHAAATPLHAAARFLLSLRGACAHQPTVYHEVSEGYGHGYGHGQ